MLQGDTLVRNRLDNIIQHGYYFNTSPMERKYIS